MTAALDFRPCTVQPIGLLEQLASRFLKRLAARNFARNTLMAYRTDLEQFVGWAQQLRGIGYVQHVTAGVVNEWVDRLIHGQGMKPRTAARKLETVKRFLDFCLRERAISANANPLHGIEAVKFQFTPVIAPEMPAYRKLLAAIPADTPIGKRDLALVLMILDAGLRVGGVTCLDMYDAARPPRWCVRPSGVITYRKKGGATADTVYSDDATGAALDAWLSVRHLFRKRREETALFLNQRGSRLSRYAVFERLKTHGSTAGMPHLHPHLLRHSRLGDVMGRGDLHQANYLAGHANKSTTADMYGSFARERMRERLRRECPLNMGDTI